MTLEPLALPGPGGRLAEEAVAVIREHSSVVPRVAIVVGSGLSGAVAAMRPDATFSYEELPGFPVPATPGHDGVLAVGELGGVAAAAFRGRIHFHEGHPMQLCSLPVRVARLLGATSLVVSAAVGGLDPSLQPGTIVVGADHINLMGEDPLRGWRTPSGAPVFTDLSDVYDPVLAGAAAGEARALGVPVVAGGIYVAARGPSYETPAELAVMRRAGGTVVGMSVVPEAVPARALGMRVLGLFGVTNSCGGKVSHEEVLAAAERISNALGPLLERLMRKIGER